MDTLLRRRIMMGQGGGGVLPAGYTQLLYVENSPGNSAYINTGVNPTTKTGFYIDAYSYDSLSGSSGFGCLFGSRVSSGHSDYQLSTYSGTYGGVTYAGLLRTGAHVGSANNAHISVNTRIVVELSGNTYTVNGVSYSAPVYLVPEGKSICLFALNQNGTITQNGHLRVYAFYLTQNGNKVIDYIPCKNPNNVVGFYDLVSESFIPPTSGTLYGVE